MYSTPGPAEVHQLSEDILGNVEAEAGRFCIVDRKFRWPGEQESSTSMLLDARVVIGRLTVIRSVMFGMTYPELQAATMIDIHPRTGELQRVTRAVGITGSAQLAILTALPNTKTSSPTEKDYEIVVDELERGQRYLAMS